MNNQSYRGRIFPSTGDSAGQADQFTPPRESRDQMKDQGDRGRRSCASQTCRHYDCLMARGEPLPDGVVAYDRDVLYVSTRPAQARRGPERGVEFGSPPGVDGEDDQNDQPVEADGGERWYLQVVRDRYVLWGYGPRGPSGVVHADRAQISLPELGDPISFALPDPASAPDLPAPEEYERRVACGWRLCREGHATSSSWSIAESLEEAVAMAGKSVDRQRFDTQVKLRPALSNVRFSDETDEANETIDGSSGSRSRCP